MRTPITNQHELDYFINTFPYGSSNCAHINTTEPLIIENAPSGLKLGDAVPGALVDVHGGTVHVETGRSDAVVRVFSDTKVVLVSGTVHAFEYAEIDAQDGGHVVASPLVLIRTRRFSKTVIEGGLVRPDMMWGGWGRPAEEWLAHYRLTPDADGVVVVYKGVFRQYNYQSDKGTIYGPGATPEAADWETGVRCGGGLHFSPTPYLTGRYTTASTKMGCPVRVDEIVTLGDKIKARRVVEPGCFLVDIHGRRIHEDGTLAAS